MKKKVLIKHSDIEKFIFFICKNLNIPKKEIDNLCKSLIGSSLRGVDSHGVRLFPHYVKCIEGGRINNRPKMKYIKKMPSVGLIDADNGFGHSASYLACTKVINLAKINGIGLVGIINSTHYGAAGAYSLEIAKNNFLGFSFTHSDSFAIPFNGIKKFHGTNPYSFSAPINKSKNLLVDFSSTSIPWNKVLRAKDKNQRLQKNVAFDQYGKSTTNAKIAESLSPLGGELFGHKGFGLSSSIEILCGPLLGIAHGYRLLSMMGPDFSSYRNLGHILIAINIESLTTRRKYYKNISNYINDLKLQKPKKNQRILYPGQKEYEEEKLRTKYGIPFDIELQNEFLKIDKNYNLNYFNKLI